MFIGLQGIPPQLLGKRQRLPAMALNDGSKGVKNFSRNATSAV
ncbi:MAG: hypothetical protein WCJ64_10615 [Rhodospirillaceae bacterium]